MSAKSVAVEEAVRLIRSGEVVAFPTETVYGLGADAANPAAVAKLFAMKGRPADHPVIVHLGQGARIEDWAVDVSPMARTLARRFWPGPLTLILRKAARVPPEVTGGQDTVAIRFPSHPVARELLRQFAQAGSGGIAAPSANRFGHVSATTAAHVREEFDEEVPVLDGGPCDVGLESTIIDLSRSDPVLLRPGGIPRATIEEALGRSVKERDRDAPRASGSLASHYAPRTALSLAGPAAFESAIGRADVAVLAMEAAPGGARCLAWIRAPADALRYGHDLYANLRRLDASGAARIVVQAPPNSHEWEAVNDRLGRAAAGMLDDEP